ncbi:unnamed protein product [Ceutorhynchus assimilis]|uniref:RFX-type winged-helix domain-containing protein n=1 Tax=Ceutorhynchus assimilis TaxID=467358 RepID=A0A9P0DGR7_9CUCU|nr:unnamed protein product [Ceutorhynchus assimilis]
MMEQEKWSADYQQSVSTSTGTGIEEGTSSSTNKSQHTKIIPRTDNSEVLNSQIKEDPDAKSIFPLPQIKNEYYPSTAVISEKSRQTIQLILAQIKSLSQNDKYLLYLKLPSEITDIIDPFRQPLNPLGSRSEISRTIVWIQTHLEEDQNISLPKKEVYNEYEQYCDKNHIKPLSQADFGKVMKQVFPKVRARRLGQRGNSKYCYSGLRRRVKLKTPILPDLNDKPLSTEATITPTSVTYAAWLIIKDWAHQQLGVQFTSFEALAHYLVRNCSVGSGSEAASKLTLNVETQAKSEESPSKSLHKHREMQLQLQKKIQQRSEGKERKRKIQTCKLELKPGTKKCRSHSVPASTNPTPTLLESTIGTLTSGECSTGSSSCGSNSVSPTQGKATICDKPEFTQLALPDFKSFQKPVLVDGGPGVTDTRQDKAASPPTNSTKVTVLKQQQQQASPKLSVSVKLRNQHKLKYKTVQPRLMQLCDIATYNVPAESVNAQAMAPALTDTRSQLVQNVQENNVNDKIPDDNLNECAEDEDFPLTRERLDSVSNVEKDAMDEYLGTNNSQHEEELSKYFNANGEAVTPPTIIDVDQTNKLSTLRQLLEQNGISEKKQIIPPINNITLPETIASPFPNNNSMPQQQMPSPSPCIPYNHVLSSLTSSTRRRVSFGDSVPPSPTTRSKNFNFTPISPGPQSPSGVQSKCSSTNASPFVSPRNTPISRSKNSTHQNAGILVTKHGKIKNELELSLEISPEIKHYNMPMSAPVSPMLNNVSPMLNNNNKSMLQKLLNADSKVQYTPEYVTNNIPDSTPLQQFFPPDLSSRSQSVPLNEMHAQIMQEIIKKDTNIVSQDLNSLENNNINAFSLDMSTNNQCLTEYGLNFINTCSETSFTPYTSPTQKPPRNITRSQSIDVNFDISKCNNPSRSVPSTPLPFTQNLKINLLDHQQNSSRSYPSTPLNSNETFIYQVNSDCLINGHPLRTESNNEFIANYNETTTVNQLDNDFAIENGETLMEDSDLLIQQGYTDNIDQ